VFLTDLPLLIIIISNKNRKKSANRSPKIQISDCYENLKSALINRPFRLIGRPLATKRQSAPQRSKASPRPGSPSSSLPVSDCEMAASYIHKLSQKPPFPLANNSRKKGIESTINSIRSITYLLLGNTFQSNTPSEMC
jgi:hypothetical protein